MQDLWRSSMDYIKKRLAEEKKPKKCRYCHKVT